MILDYSGGTSVIIRVLIRGREEDQGTRDVRTEVREERRCYAAGFENGGTKECRQPLKTGKGKKMNSPLMSLEVMQPCGPILDF